MNYKEFFENIVNDKDEPTEWNHKNLLCFDDYTKELEIQVEPKEEDEPMKPKKQKISKEISKKVL
jgi:hypothetical protein